MTWIPVIPSDQAEGTLQQAYQEVYALYPAEYSIVAPTIVQADGSADSIVAAHSLIPDAMKHAMSTLGVLLSPDLPLTRRQQEMIATVVSTLNGCFYWRESHAHFLRLVSLEEKLAAQLERDYTQASLNPMDRAMLDYAARLTQQAYRVAPADLEHLRQVGFTDQAILQINLIASWFNYINRVADGLGVGKGENPLSNTPGHSS